MASHGRYRQSMPQTHDQPPIQHLGQLPPAVLQRPAGRPHAREFANLAVVGFLVVDLFVVRPIKGSLHVFSNQLAPHSVLNCVYRDCSAGSQTGQEDGAGCVARDTPQVIGHAAACRHKAAYPWYWYPTGRG